MTKLTGKVSGMLPRMLVLAAPALLLAACAAPAPVIGPCDACAAAARAQATADQALATAQQALQASSTMYQRTLRK
jgi:hypothetical protein